MNDKNRYKLYFGPYHPPKVERGQRLFDEIRGTVVVELGLKGAARDTLERVAAVLNCSVEDFAAPLLSRKPVMRAV